MIIEMITVFLHFPILSSGEFQLRLRQLEKSLLQALNEVKGRILDDDTIITTLENLKKEAAEVTRKVEETDIVMAEVETVSQQYLSLSSACSSIYFTMEALNQVCSPIHHTGDLKGNGIIQNEFIFDSQIIMSDLIKQFYK